jgi:heptosyltransferase II
VFPLKIKLLKFLDRTAGTIATLLLTSPASASQQEMRSFLLIRPGGIGDAVLLTPVVNAIRAQFPAAKITVLAERRNASVFRLCPCVDHVLLRDCPSDLVAVLNAGVTIVIDTEQ